MIDTFKYNQIDDNRDMLTLMILIIQYIQL